MEDVGASLMGTLLLMFVGALLCGAAPFFLRIRESHLQTLAALGAGLLIGSALAVIIPEGFHAFAEASHHSHEHGEVKPDHDHNHDHSAAHDHSTSLPEGVAGLVLVGGFLAMLLLDHLQHAAGGRCGAPGHSHHGHSHNHGHSHSHGLGSGGASSERLREKGEGAAAKSKAQGAAPEAAAAANEPAAGAAGAAPAGLASPAKARPGAEADVSGKAKGAAPDPQNAITGLLIHCCADGLAMGAAFLSGNARLSMIIAAAMVLHKAPMAFGLATYLMACRWNFARSRGTLLAFASAAPAATLATYALLGSLAILQHPAAVALCVIFSGGTFLYAATMHILPEVLGDSHHMSSAQLAAVVVGSLLPVALSWGHHH
ncbi:zinc transporter ZIP9 isoform X1 isoform A [Chlorella sorokiniana]|jgi:zinc transporter 9|uniref:Zinc transporter ZIP9 isoform X1 isoform A n=1 Tax=Chlorella sorokiniana TaxID=3076 RepID=A0A2P6TWB9_CHLSO|nr:zinc transporter ZIP9 isoform X1 isoform A [Chlorella sorokiniana]|eukprot:PRW58354.1 zinc transporter ZIP9 isoform X1 isoform A [Chlorella sorokiniana]